MPTSFYGQSYAVWVVAFRSDHQAPRTILDVSHGVGGVAHQVQDHLLKLHAIPGNKKGIAIQLGPQDHAISLQVI